MGSSQGAKKGRSYLGISSQITVNNVIMSSQSINNWRNAINAARSAQLPRRRSLIDLFEVIKIDGHLESVMDKRRTAITNKRINWQGKTDTNKDFIEDNILGAPWFHALRGHAIDAKSYGFSLIELQSGKDGLIEDVELLPRQNTFPEYKFYAFSTGTSAPADDLGIYFEDDPYYNNTTLFVGGKKDYGKLMTVAQYVIYKRGGFGDWAQFAELFGMPFRVGEYDPWDDETRRKLYEGLDQMGGAGFAVIPKGSSLTFHDTNGTGKSEVFRDIIKECNAEISKAYLGGTMTTDDGSSRSQSEVHQDGQNEIHISDMIEMEYLLNWKLKPKLIALGYPLDKGKFGYPETNKLPLDKHVDMILKTARLVDIDEEYIYKVTGVERPRPGSNPVRISSSAPVEDDLNDDDTDVDPVDDPKSKTGKTAKKKSSKQNLKALYSAHTHGAKIKLSAGQMSSAYESIFDRIASEIHSGKIISGNIDPELFAQTKSDLLKALTGGYGGTFEEYDPGTPDFDMLVSLNKNLHVFSAFKTHKQLRVATDLLTDEVGNIKPWTQFRNEITGINKEYNINYLQAEYNTAIASGQMAGRWVDIERNADLLPMLTFRTTEGDNVCPICGGYNGITRPVKDPFWLGKYPPLHFNCNCDVDQSDDAELSSLEGREFPKLQPMFENNVGINGVVFPESHPYFQVSNTDKKQVKNFLKHHESEAAKLEESFKQYNSFGATYIKEGFDKKSGGYVVRHKKHKGPESTDNLITSRHLMNRGDRIELIPKNKSGTTTDANRNQVPWEFKKVGKPTNPTNAIFQSFRRGKKQDSNVLVRLDHSLPKGEVIEGIQEAIRKDKLEVIQNVEILLANNPTERIVFTRTDLTELSITQLTAKIKSE